MSVKKASQVAGSASSDYDMNTDYSALFKEQAAAGADYDTLKQIAANRAYKTATDSTYGVYQNDATQKAMEAYLESIKPATSTSKVSTTPSSSASSSAVSSAPSYPYQYESQKDMWEQSGYQEILDSQKKALDSYVTQQTNELEAQKSGVNQSAEQAAQEAYISYMQGKKNMAQALAASGYSGGMADSQALALESGYQGNVKDILLNRDNTLNDIDTAINNAKLEGSIQSAQAQAELGRDALSAWQSYINQQNAYANSDFWTKYGYDYQAGQNQLDRDFQAEQTQKGYDFQAGENQLDRDFQANQTQQGYDFQAGQNQLDRDFQASQTQGGYQYETEATEKERAWNLILNGIMPDSSLLETAGISEAAASAYVAKIQSQLASSSKTAGTGTSTTSSKPTLTAAQTKEALENGIINEQTQAAYRYYYGQDYTPEPSQYDTISTTVKNRVQSMLSTEGTEAAEQWAASYLNQQLNLGQLSEAEVNALAEELEALISSLSPSESKRTDSAVVGGTLRDPIVEVMR